MDQPDQSTVAKALAFSREHPVLVTLLLLGGIGGSIGAVYIAPQELSFARRALGGALAGLLFAMCALGFRLYE